jgi:hypothetical protein
MNPKRTSSVAQLADGGNANVHKAVLTFHLLANDVGVSCNLLANALSLRPLAASCAAYSKSAVI